LWIWSTRGFNSVKGKETIDNKRNVNFRNGKISNLTIRNDLDIKGNLTVDGSQIGTTPPSEQREHLAATFDVEAAGAADAWIDIPQLSLTLEPGRYLIGYKVCAQTTECWIRARLIDDANMEIPGSQGVGGHLVTAVNTGVDMDTMSITCFVNVSASSVYKAQVSRTVICNSCLLFSSNSTTHWTAPDPGCTIWAVRLSD
jgi:hypothetical protein